MEDETATTSSEQNHELAYHTSTTAMWEPLKRRHSIVIREGDKNKLPLWIASLLHAAKHLKSGRARRKKVYRLLQRKLMYYRVGVKEGDQFHPTYVYPEEVKQLIRSVFSQDICDYPDPCHDQVVYLTLEDLHKVDIN